MKPSTRVEHAVSLTTKVCLFISIPIVCFLATAYFNTKVDPNVLNTAISLILVTALAITNLKNLYNKQLTPDILIFLLSLTLLPGLIIHNDNIINESNLILSMLMLTILMSKAYTSHIINSVNFEKSISALFYFYIIASIYLNYNLPRETHSVENMNNSLMLFFMALILSYSFSKIKFTTLIAISIYIWSSGSRSASIGALTLIFTFAFIYRSNFILSGRAKIKTALLIFITASSIFIGTRYLFVKSELLPQKYKHRISRNLIATDIKSSPRFSLFKSSLDIFLDHPLTGTGPNTYMFENIPRNKYFDFKNNIFKSPHNIIAKLASEYGIFGLAATLIAFLVTLCAWLKISTLTQTDFSTRYIFLFTPLLAIDLLLQFPFELAHNYFFLSLYFSILIDHLFKSKYTFYIGRTFFLTLTLFFFLQTYNYLKAHYYNYNFMWAKSCKTYPSKWRFCTHKAIEQHHQNLLNRHLQLQPLNFIALRMSNDSKIKDIALQYQNSCALRSAPWTAQCLELQNTIKKRVQGLPTQ